MLHTGSQYQRFQKKKNKKRIYGSQKNIKEKKSD